MPKLESNKLAAAAATGFQRTADLAARGDRLEKCFWNGINQLRGGQSNSGALVGDAGQIVDALMEYYDDRRRTPSFCAASIRWRTRSASGGRSFCLRCAQRVAARDAETGGRLMPCEIVGLHFFADSSELRPLKGVFDPGFVRDCAVAHEEAGFDRVLIGQTATWPDGLATAGHIAAVTTKLKFMVAHRPGFIPPTMAARMFATLDQISGGRVGVHVITGASDIETQADGDFLTKNERYRRSREYVDVLRKMWTSATPFDFAGDWYRFNGAFAMVKPVQPAIPIFWGGSSDLAIELGAQVADVYAVGPAPVADTAAHVARFKSEAAKSGRNPGISMSMRVVVGETEDEAWAKAQTILDSVTRYQSDGVKIGREKEDADPGAQALIALAERGDCLDERLWTGITKATQGRLHATALVGTADQVSDALMAYYAVGVDRFLINGFDTIADVRLFGRALVPMIRAKVAAADAASA